MSDSKTENTTSPQNEANSLMLQVKAQEAKIAELSKLLEGKNQALDRLQTEKRAEMESLLTGLREWIGKLDVKSDNDRSEVINGLERLAKQGNDQNGIWRVMVTASAAALQQESEYQKLKSDYDALNKQHIEKSPSFDNADARVGSKRPADCDSEPETGGDIWSAFIADVHKTGYE